MRSVRLATILGDREDPRRRLVEVFGGDPPAGGQPPETAMRWARQVLASTGGSAEDEVAAIRRIRAAEPRLTLRAARFLAVHALRDLRT